MWSCIEGGLGVVMYRRGVGCGHALKVWSCIEGGLGVVMYRRHVGCDRVYMCVCVCTGSVATG